MRDLKRGAKAGGSTKARLPRHSNRWSAQEAKAGFSELVRRAREHGPQIVSLHGKDVVQVTAVDAGKGGFTGAELIAAMRACPVKGFMDDLPEMPSAAFRDIEL